jgi:hypothetical protein
MPSTTPPGNLTSRHGAFAAWSATTSFPRRSADPSIASSDRAGLAGKPPKCHLTNRHRLARDHMPHSARLPRRPFTASARYHSARHRVRPLPLRPSPPPPVTTPPVTTPPVTTPPVTTPPVTTPPVTTPPVTASARYHSARYHCPSPPNAVVPPRRRSRRLGAPARTGRRPSTRAEPRRIFAGATLTPATRSGGSAETASRHPRLGEP